MAENLTAGVRVRLHSLQAAAQHNGVDGHLLKWNASSGRWGVKLSTGQELSVRPANVMPTCSHAGCGQRIGASEAVGAGLRTCAKCRRVVYCSRTCQKAAWKGGLFLRVLLQGSSWKRWQPGLFGDEKAIKGMGRLNAWWRSSAEPAAITFSDPRTGAREKRRIEEAEGLHFPHRADSCNKVESRLTICWSNSGFALAAALRVLTLFKIADRCSSLAALALVLIAAILRALRKARHQACL